MPSVQWQRDDEKAQGVRLVCAPRIRPAGCVGATAGVATTAPQACEAEGLLEVAGVRNRLAVGLGNGEAQFSIGDVIVATIPEVSKPDGTFGFTVQNSAPSLLSHAHFDNLAVVSF